MDGTLGMLRKRVDAREWWRQSHEDRLRGVKSSPTPGLWDGPIRLSSFDGVTENAVIELPLPGFGLFERFADGTWLLHSGSWYTVYRPDGTAIRSIILGQRLAQLRCSPDGGIWVGYPDQEIFMGAYDFTGAGIVKFSPESELLWANPGSQLEICDSYALTLDGDVAWACFYDEFPITRIEGGVIRQWGNAIKGARALAVDGDHVVLAGGYEQCATRLALLRLEGNEAHHLRDLRFPDAVKGEVTLMQGHGSVLHLVHDGGWTRIDVAAVRAALLV